MLNLITSANSLLSCKVTDLVVQGLGHEQFWGGGCIIFFYHSNLGFSVPSWFPIT